MSWALFCQIEVILLTAGLIIAFLLSVRQNTKDNSFFKRVSVITKALGETLGDLGKAIVQMNEKEQH